MQGADFNSIMQNEKKWENFLIKYRASYYPPVDDFHEHDYYEINFILSGNVKIILPDCIDEGTDCRIVMTSPRTPHFVSCKSDMLYSRFYLLLSKEYIKECCDEFINIADLFGEKGKIVTISSSEQELCRMLVSNLENEKNILRQKLLVLYLFSYIHEFSNKILSLTIPKYIMHTLVFIEEHYFEKLTAEKLAKRFHIGRTTLMTNFKKYVGTTLNNYISKCRVKKAIEYLCEGKKEAEVAELCGFCDASSLIDTFKMHFNTTPRKYLKEKQIACYLKDNTFKLETK